MTTYSFQSPTLSFYQYDDFESGESFSGESYFSYTFDITVAEGDVDFFTVMNGELTHPELKWEDHFNWFEYWSISDIKQLTWDGEVTYFFTISESYSFYYFDGYSFGSEYMHVAVDGAAMPDFSHLPADEQVSAFYDFYNGGTITDASRLFPDGMTIALADLPGVEISEDDTFYGTQAADTVGGGKGRDVFVEGDAGGADKLDGGEGRDSVDYLASDPSQRVVVDLADSSGNGGLAAGDILISIENVFGSVGDDRLRGTDGANTLRGEDGDDVLSGRDGNDKLQGGTGDDQLKGGWGADDLDGGDGMDKAIYLSERMGALIDMADPGSSTGQAAGDTFIDVEIIVASKLDDILRGDDGDNRLKAGSGNDALRGRAGNDVLFGGDGDDRLNGDAGDDVLVGGAGSDDFLFAGGHDVIHDLSVHDMLWISNRFASGAILTQADIEAAAVIVDGTLELHLGPAHSLRLLGHDAVEDIAGLFSGF